MFMVMKMTKKEALKYLDPETGVGEILGLVGRKDRMEIIKDLMEIAYQAVLESITFEDDLR